jgi:hypothetical protein
MKDIPNAEDFRQEIKRMRNASRVEGHTFIDIISKDVHRNLGGYPSKDHRMPICCEAMYSMMRPNDNVLYKPPKGKGASLKIRYFI